MTRSTRRTSWAALAVVALPVLATAAAAAAAPATQTIAIRGESQTLRLYGARGGVVAVVASGDGGWTHLGPYVAEFLARKGYFVVGFDSKGYLSSFTKGDKTLSAADVPGDFAALVGFAAGGGSAPPILVGVSEGAGLSVLAATAESVKAKIAGVLVLGLPDKNELGWRFRDSVIYVTKGIPNEPLFSAADVIGQVAPVPIVAIHSTKDEFVPVEEIRRVMDRAREPKQLQLIEASDHKFSGGEEELNRQLLAAIEWIRRQPH
jgi:alpha-beta hydrolase superfamily lysophospholipase